MRAAVILGLGSSTKQLKPFQRDSDATWITGLPTSSTEADVVLILGGDGTIHRHLPQLVKLQLPVLVVPRGSGNDLARALGLRSIRDSLAAWRKFSSGSGNVRTIDLGIITPWEKKDAGEPALSAVEGAPAPHVHYFSCVGGVGLDGEIARRANRLPRWLRRHGGYVLSFLPVLFQYESVFMKIMTPDGGRGDGLATRSAKPTVLAVFANAPAYGGGMKIAPRAQLDDGRLDFCVISDIDRFRLFCLFPSVYFGRHLNMPEVEYFQAERLRIETEKPLDVYADGEYVCRTPIELSVARHALRVIVP